MKKINLFKLFSITVVNSWLWLLAVIPFLWLMAVSLFTWNPHDFFSWPLTLDNYRELFEVSFFKVILRSFWFAFIATVICLLLAFPFTYALVRTTQPWQSTLLLFVLIPFWTSSLIRSYALITLLKAKGLFNTLLLSLGLIKQPLELLFTNGAVVFGLVYNLLPFMILPIYIHLQRFDQRLIEAAEDLGASPTRIFFKIVLPMSEPGIVIGCIMVFLPAMTLFYIPDMLGGARSSLLGNLIQDQFMLTRNWPLGAAISMTLIAIMLLMLCFYKKHKGRPS